MKQNRLNAKCHVDHHKIINLGRRFYNYNLESDFCLGNLFEEKNKAASPLAVIESAKKEKVVKIARCPSVSSVSHSELESCKISSGKMNSSPSAKALFRMKGLNFEKMSQTLQSQ